MSKMWLQLLTPVFILSSLFKSHVINSQKDLEQHSHHHNDSNIQTGVGFDLTGSYGVAAISYANGSIVGVVKVNGSPDHHELLARLSLASSRHPAPPYKNFADAWRDQSRQQLRKLRKAVGLPASADVATFSIMIKALRDAVEIQLGHRILSAAVTTPHLFAIYEEDLQDSFEHLGLERIRLPFRSSLVFETSAAFAGNGLGLCRNFTDQSACHELLSNSPDVIVMAVLYTKSALTVSLSVTTSAYYLWEPPYRRLEDFGLGYDARHNNMNEDFYWERLRDRLQEIMIKNPFYDKPDMVLLHGESACEERFRHVLEEALRSVMPKIPEILDTNAETVVARGAAELAKRAPWNPWENALTQER